MAANLTTHAAIVSIGTQSGNQPRILTIGEDAGETFKQGTPVMSESGTGFIQAWDGTTIAIGIAGITLINGSNYSTDAAGAPNGFTGIGAPGTSTTFGSVPFQVSAVNIPHGAPFVDGRTKFEAANTDTIFQAQIDSAGGSAYASLQSQIGSQFGLTKDAAGGMWFIDLDKTTVGTNTVLTIIGFNPIQPLGTNGALAWFQFKDAVCQFLV